MLAVTWANSGLWKIQSHTSPHKKPRKLSVHFIVTTQYFALDYIRLVSSSIFLKGGFWSFFYPTYDAEILCAYAHKYASVCAKRDSSSKCTFWWISISFIQKRDVAIPITVWYHLHFLQAFISRWKCVESALSQISRCLPQRCWNAIFAKDIFSPLTFLTFSNGADLISLVKILPYWKCFPVVCITIYQQIET